MDSKIPYHKFRSSSTGDAGRREGGKNSERERKMDRESAGESEGKRGQEAF